MCYKSDGNGCRRWSGLFLAAIVMMMAGWPMTATVGAADQGCYQRFYQSVREAIDGHRWGDENGEADRLRQMLAAELDGLQDRMGSAAWRQFLLARAARSPAVAEAWNAMENVMEGLQAEQDTKARWLEILRNTMPAFVEMSDGQAQLPAAVAGLFVVASGQAFEKAELNGAITGSFAPLYRSYGIFTSLLRHLRRLERNTDVYTRIRYFNELAERAAGPRQEASFSSVEVRDNALALVEVAGRAGEIRQIIFLYRRLAVSPGR